MREDLDSEFVRRKGEIEKEKFTRVQLLQEEYQQKENERDAEKSEYFKELEVHSFPLLSPSLLSHTSPSPCSLPAPSSSVEFPPLNKISK